MNGNGKRPADTQEAAWIADEDKFVLQQAKKKAAIRVKEGRAKPVDWLAITLRFGDTTRSAFDDEVEDAELEIVDPEGVFHGLDSDQLAELEKDIDVYASLERDKANLEFWHTVDVICKDRRKLKGPKARSQDSVSGDVDKLFSSKTLAELDNLEKQIRAKLRSDEPIDTEYWENLLQSLISWKARARLRMVSQSLVDKQLKGLRQQQAEDASRIRSRLSNALSRAEAPHPDTSTRNATSSTSLDPEPLLKVSAEDSRLRIQDENDFLSSTATERQKIIKLGFVPLRKTPAGSGPSAQAQHLTNKQAAPARTDESSAVAKSLYEREAARGVAEDEEVFASEEQVETAQKPQWAGNYRARKPRYFNRVQMGYEWNKYNQTHYDHDNPPPKVVQGYKFNVFYPELMDKTKTPTYKIVRDDGRKRGQTFAPAGEEDTCLIKFMAGPPYEDIAFRIVDRDWDYSAKRERGFKSSFDKGILQLHFQFKKIFYRK